MARVLLALVLLATLYGCGQPNSPAEKQEKEAGVEEAAKGREPVKTVEEPTTPETPPQAPEPEPAPEPAQAEEPPEYSIEDDYIDKGGGPGSAAALQVIAPDVERGEEAARLVAAEYAEHDYVMMTSTLLEQTTTPTLLQRWRSPNAEPDGPDLELAPIGEGRQWSGVFNAALPSRTIERLLPTYMLTRSLLARPLMSALSYYLL